MYITITSIVGSHPRVSGPAIWVGFSDGVGQSRQSMQSVSRSVKAVSQGSQPVSQGSQPVKEVSQLVVKAVSQSNKSVAENAADLADCCTANTF